MTDKWVIHFTEMAKGKLPHTEYYSVNDQIGLGAGADIKLITPSQSVSCKSS